MAETASYTRKELLRKITKIQREIEKIMDPAMISLYKRKAEKYKRLLADMDLEASFADLGVHEDPRPRPSPSPSPSPSPRPIPSPKPVIPNTLDEAVATFYKGDLSPKEDVVVIKITPFEKTFANPAATGYRLIQTIGDGDCLIHAILTSTSLTYRHIPVSERRSVANFIRRTFIANKINDPDAKAFFKGREYLEDQHLVAILNLFGYNVIVFNELPKDRRHRPNIMVGAPNNITFLSEVPNKPWFLLYNALGSKRGSDHYSAVQTPEGQILIDNYEEGLIIGQFLGPQTESEKICAYDSDEIVYYRGQAYIVIERRFDGDPPRCATFTIQHLETGKQLHNILVRDIQKLVGGYSRTRKHDKHKKNLIKKKTRKHKKTTQLSLRPYYSN